MEDSSSAAVPRSSSSTEGAAQPLVLSSVRLSCRQALYTLRDRRSEMSKILNVGRSPEQDTLSSDLEVEDLNTLLLKAEKLLEDVMNSTWKVKAEEINDKRAKKIMAKLRVIHKQAAEVWRKMSALLERIKDKDPEVAEEHIHLLMEKNKRSTRLG